MKNQQDYKVLAEKALDDIRFILQSDGGDIKLEDVSDDGKIVKVSFKGMCAACPINEITLKGSVKQSLQKYLPQLEDVINVDI